MMHIEWSFAHIAYVIVFGDSLVDIDGKRFFESKAELKGWLKPKGLTIRENKVVVI